MGAGYPSYFCLHQSLETFRLFDAVLLGLHSSFCFVLFGHGEPTTALLMFSPVLPNIPLGDSPEPWYPSGILWPAVLWKGCCGLPCKVCKALRVSCVLRGQVAFCDPSSSLAELRFGDCVGLFFILVPPGQFYGVLVD